MVLQAYLSNTDPHYISSIGNPGPKERRRKVSISKSHGSTLRIRVPECPDHYSPLAAVPVVVFGWNHKRKAGRKGENWLSYGKAKACPLCWRLLTEPEEGMPPTLEYAGPFTYENMGPTKFNSSIREAP